MSEKRSSGSGWVLLLLVLGVIAILYLAPKMQKKNDVSYSEMRELFLSEQVEEFTIADTRLTATLHSGDKATCELYDFALFY